MKTREIARVVAGEAAYRAKRRSVKLGMVPRQAGAQSALSANLFLTLFYLLFSGMMLVAIAASPTLESLIAIMLTTVAVVAFFNLFNVTFFAAVFFSENLYEPLRLLPLDASQTARILEAAYLLYWGGLSVTALFLPPTLAAALYRPQYAAYSLLSLAASAAVYYTTLEAGLVLGSYSRLAKSNAVFSVISAAGWVTLMVAYAFMPQLLISAVEAGNTAVQPLLAALPFVGLVLAPLYPLPALASAILTLSLMWLIHVKAGQVKAPSYHRGGRAGFRPLKPLNRIAALVVKDYELMLREPRRMAAIFYLYIFPLIFLFTPSPALMILSAAAAGTTAPVWIYIEGEGARHLYELPLTFTDIYAAKLADTLIPLALLSTLVALAAPLAGYEPWLSLLFAAVAAGEAGLMLLIFLAEIPSTPSAWTEAATGRARSMVYMLLSMALAAGVPGVGLSYAGPAAATLIGAVFAAAVAAAGYAYTGRRGAL